MAQDINEVYGDPELELWPNLSAHELNADGQHDELEDRSECPACFDPRPAWADEGRGVTTTAPGDEDYPTREELRAQDGPEV